MTNKSFFLVSRSIFESKIWSDDPHVLKLFIYLVGTARHSKKAKKYPDFEVTRGELITSLKQISDNNEYMKNGRLQTWSRSKVSRMVKLLEEQEYITILSDTYGTHISICNYNTYQTVSNYLPNTSETQLQRNCNDTETLLGTYNNVNKDKNDKNVIKKNKFLNPEEIRTICEDNLSQMATPKFIIPVLRQVPEGMWGNVLSFIMRRFPADNLGSKYYNESVKTLREEKQCQTKQR